MQLKIRWRKSLFVIWGLVLVTAATLGVLVGLAVRERRAAARGDGAAPEAAVQKTVRVEGLRVAPRAVEDVLELPGVLDAFAAADVAAEKGGRIVEMAVEKGDRVVAGDLLLHIDGRLWEQAEREATIHLREAEKEWERWQELDAAGAVSASEFDALRMRRDLAEVALEQARVHRSQCEVRAPIAGVVDARHVELGEYVSEGQAVLRVADVDRLKLRLDIPEMDVAAVSEGQALEFTVLATGQERFTARVSHVAAMGRAGSRTFETEALVEASDTGLKPGMIANVSLVRRTIEDAIVVPLAAVVPRKGEHIVFTVENGHAVRNRVQIRAIVGDAAVLEAGVEAGQVVVVAGQRTLQDGAPVEMSGGTDAP